MSNHKNEQKTFGHAHEETIRIDDDPEQTKKKIPNMENDMKEGVGKGKVKEIESGKEKREDGKDKRMEDGKEKGMEKGTGKNMEKGKKG